MIEKITGLSRVNFSIGKRVALIYLKKMLGITIVSADFSYLTYYNFLIRCDLIHQHELTDSFIVKTKSGTSLYMRKYPSSDFAVLFQIWREKEYEVVVGLLRKKIQTKQLRIIDAGANVGYSTVYLYQALKNDFDISIVCIEPGDGNVKQIEQNFQINGIKNFKIEKAGVFNKSCYLEVLRDFRDGKDWSLRVQEVDHKTDLSSVEIQEVIKGMNWDYVDFCKIDIEGSEKYLFQDGEYAKEMLSKVKVISIEIHKELNIDEKICATLEQNNFSYFKHGEITIGTNELLTK